MGLIATVKYMHMYIYANPYLLFYANITFIITFAVQDLSNKNGKIEKFCDFLKKKTSKNVCKATGSSNKSPLPFTAHKH